MIIKARQDAGLAQNLAAHRAILQTGCKKYWFWRLSASEMQPFFNYEEKEAPERLKTFSPLAKKQERAVKSGIPIWIAAAHVLE